MLLLKYAREKEKKKTERAFNASNVLAIFQKHFYIKKYPVAAPREFRRGTGRALVSLKHKLLSIQLFLSRRIFAMQLVLHRSDVARDHLFALCDVSAHREHTTDGQGFAIRVCLHAFAGHRSITSCESCMPLFSAPS